MNDAMIEWFERQLIAFDVVPPREGRALWARWHEVYLRAVGLAAAHRGSPIPWEVLTDDSVVTLEGKRALAAYAGIQDRQYYVFQADLPLALRCSSPDLPDFGASGVDACVTALDFSWTMAFSHEDGRYGGLGWGPFYSRAEWQAEARPAPKPRRRR